MNPAANPALLPESAHPVFVETEHTCQFCHAALRVTWADLDRQPLANDYCHDLDTARHARAYALHARFCEACLLVQVDPAVPPDAIFSDYPYQSSYSTSWLQHCESYAAAMIERFGLRAGSQVIEVGSNDGCLLRFFAQRGTAVLGIDPAANLARIARAAGVPTEIAFFGAETAASLVARGIQADHISAKNVLAHVPDISDFMHGVALLLKPEAAFTVEFPHLLETIAGLQFDQIYHEHFYYLSLMAVRNIAAAQGLRVFDVEQIPTHGGSLRVYICHEDAAHRTTPSVARVIGEEMAAHLHVAAGYEGFGPRIRRARAEFRAFIAEQRAVGKVVAGYGAAAKGNTFLNYCGADPGSLAFIADRSASKIGRAMPGSGIPIVDVDAIVASRPDYLVILPWNLREEISSQMSYIGEWGGKFVTAIPSLKIF